MHSLFITHLENQLVCVDAIGQAEARSQVILEVGDFLDGGQELRVHRFLVLLPLLCQLVLLFLRVKEIALLVATSEQNEDSSWGDAGTQSPLMLAEGLLAVALKLARNILCWVVAGHFAQFDNTGASILVSSNSLDHSSLWPHLQLLLGLGLCGLGLPLVHSPAGEHGRPRVPANAPGQNRVPAAVPLLGNLLLVA